jgi:integrase
VLLGGKLHVYRRENSRYWQCSAFFDGRNHRTSTKQEGLTQAKDFAEEWYLELKGKLKRGEAPTGGKSFKLAADRFLKEIEGIIADERSPSYVYEHDWRLRVHLLPFFGRKALSEITPGLVQDYRIHRSSSRKDPRSLKSVIDPETKKAKRDAEGRIVKDPNSGVVAKPSRSSLHKEIVTLRQVLKCANRHGWLPYLPDLTTPFRGSSKISHRAWFSNDEYIQLYTATGERARKPKKARWRWASEQLHDYVLFAGNSGLRPDEMGRLEFRDIKIITDDATEKEILLIEVRGKRGVGYCKTMPGAVLPFKRLRERLRPAKVEGDEGAGVGRRAVRSPKQGETLPRPNDRLFPQTHRQFFNDILGELKLKQDRDGQERTFYSLRHYYICQRLSEGADIYQIAKNCRTSVEMIEKFYASHLANTLNAAAINVRAPKPKKAAGAKNAKKPKQ